MKGLLDGGVRSAPLNVAPAPALAPSSAPVSKWRKVRSGRVFGGSVAIVEPGGEWARRVVTAAAADVDV